MEPPNFAHRDRSPSKSSVLKSIFPPNVHKRSQSSSDALTGRYADGKAMPITNGIILPADHPHSRQQHPLSERASNKGTSSSQSSKSNGSSGGGTGKPLHTKTKSSVSLKSLLKDKDKKEPSSKDSADGSASKHKKPKKTKSSTSLSSIFRRSHRGRKGNESECEKDKENYSLSGRPENELFYDTHHDSNQSLDNRSTSSFAWMNRRSVHEEMSLYTPRGYSPSKQRNFHDSQQPTLTKRSNVKSRPKSDYVTSSSFAVRDMLASVRRSSPPGRPKDYTSRGATDEFHRKPLNTDGPAMERGSNSNGRRGSRVFAAIAAFSSKDKSTTAAKQVGPNEIETAFEELLESRNIPLNMRDKMRSLNTTIKADFITKHQVEGEPENSPQKKKESRSRPRSRTLTLSKGDSSPSKKSKSDGTPSKRPKSVDLSSPRPTSSRGLPSSVLGSMSQLMSAPDNTADPSDFVHYLKEVQKPEIVEVTKLHKLRILLRNETVVWVDSFISHGGMDELIQLLYRTIKVEWREEHEDTLMHEVLLCLKALCTTSPALRRLRLIQDDLFPTLLHMLFDEEKKGPSEFTTRGIIISLLFTLLSTAPPSEQRARAQTILSYMRDPAPPESSQPLTFIADIYQSRPYRVWCKEVTNVTKEVFWIFLHHFNVVPAPKLQDDEVDITQPYAKRHFPPPHPPVPAAPYVGGVEWDATNYLANHLDLINGIVASMPTSAERNTIRLDLQASGFEKVMGRSMRTCKEQFYPSLHAGLRVWVAAAAEDGWDTQFVREGPPRDTSPSKAGCIRSPKKGPGIVSEAPPRLDIGVSIQNDRGHNRQSSDWL